MENDSPTACENWVFRSKGLAVTMTAAEWVAHWTDRAPLIPDDTLRELLDSIAEDVEEEA
jgi:hypothetical protein